VGVTYEELYRDFRWNVPADANIGVDITERHPRDATAILVSDGRAVTRRVSFGELVDDSNRLANALRAAGIERGDRVGIALPQRPEAAVAHAAVYKLGAIAVPLSTRFGPDALAVRLGDAGAKLVLGEAEMLERIAEAGLDSRLLDVDSDLAALLTQASPRFAAVRTSAHDPALIVYTSGTTGPPKGALLAHRTLHGHLPGFELSHDFFPQEGDVIWSPADWAWMGGLFDVLLPGLYHGRPVVAFQTTRFDPERTYELVERLGVRNLFLPATALRMLRGHGGRRLALRTLASGGETVGEETAAWCEEALGARLNEFYGQTEANLLLGNCAAWPAVPGSMGRPYPGHDVRLIDGEIAVSVDGDPVAFLGYWGNEEATRAKVRDGWLHTGDLATEDDAGYLHFVGRADDLISSAGHRIGPGEIEDCLVRHPAVALAAVIGVPDEVRGEAIKAFVVLAPGVTASEELAAELQAHVRSRLAAYEVPRQVEFVAELPLTVSGKIRRSELRTRHRDRVQST
jgi:acetyl-CoA synthetase